MKILCALTDCSAKLIQDQLIRGIPPFPRIGSRRYSSVSAPQLQNVPTKETERASSKYGTRSMRGIDAERAEKRGNQKLYIVRRMCET